MQVPKLRFKEFNDEWKTYKLKDFSSRVTRKNKNNISHLPLTISAQDGLVDQTSFFNKTVASKDLSGYYLLFKGDFAYNKSYSNGYPWGAIKRLDKYDMGVLSTLYICFKPDNTINSNFLAQLFNSAVWYNGVSEIAVEGARNHGLLNISVGDFFETTYKIPSLEEQTKISDFLSLIDKKIELQQKLVDNLQLYKKGLLKKVFSNTQGWKTAKLGEFLIEYNEKTTINNQYPVLTSSRKGLFLQKDYFDKQVASDNNIGYNILPYNYITYRNASDDATFYFNINNIIEYGIVSPLYPIFTTKDMNIIFIQLILNYSNEFKKYCLEQQQGGTRTSMSISKLKEFKIKIPSIEEQNRIANLFTNLDKKIDFETNKLKNLKEYKKGLLQQMFI